jgi:diaminopimelate decarboxylase
MTKLQKILPHLEKRNLLNDKPLFVYDPEEIRENIDFLSDYWKNFLGKKSSFFYSIKSNPNPDLIRFLDAFVAGFDASSEREFRYLLGLGIPSSRISLSGPAKTDSFFALAKANPPAALHCDNLEELDLALAANLPISLRITVGNYEKLGFSEPSFLAAVSKLAPGSLMGVHFYLGRESFQPEAFVKQMQKIQALLSNGDKKSKDFKIYAGLGMPVKEVLSPLNEHKLTLDHELILECGRSLVSSCGMYIAPVLAKKRLEQGKEAVIINGGVQHLGGNLFSPVFGDKLVHCSSYRKNTGILANETKMSVYGSLCLATDCLHPGLLLPKSIQRGDYLVLSPFGAYGLSASAHQFILQDLPEEWIFERKNGNLKQSSTKAAFV